MSLLLDALRKAAESKNRQQDGSDGARDPQRPAAEQGFERSEHEPDTAAKPDAAQHDQAHREAHLPDLPERADQTIPPPIPGFDSLPSEAGEHIGHGESVANDDTISDDAPRPRSDAELAHELRGLRARLQPRSDPNPGERETDRETDRDPVASAAATQRHDGDGNGDGGHDDGSATHRPTPSAATEPAAGSPSTRPAPNHAGEEAGEAYDQFDETQRLEEPLPLNAEPLPATRPGSPDQARNLFTSKSVRKPIRQRPNALGLVLVLVSLGVIGAWLYFGYGEHQFSLQRDLARIRSSAPIQPDPPSAAQSAAVRAEAEANGLPQVTAAGAQSAAGDDDAATETSTPTTTSATTPASRQVSTAAGSGDRGSDNPDIAGSASAPVAESTSAASATDTAATISAAAADPDPAQQLAQRPLQRATDTRSDAESAVADQIGDGDDARQAAPSQPPQSPVSPVSPVSRAADAPANGSLSIARNQRDAPIDQLIKNGYSAYQAGRLDVAGDHYRKALGIDGNHRDALLGAAAVALRGGSGADAARYYQRLLQLNPRDPAALVGLRSLSQSGDPAQLETELSLLLERVPESAPLHFALGGVYSRGRRWAEAQQAYFNAHRLDAGNPDYLYNLAISLDNLGKRDAAAEFYHQALEAAQRRAASFDQNVALARFHALQGVQ